LGCPAKCLKCAKMPKVPKVPKIMECYLFYEKICLSRKHEMTPVKQKRRINRAGENTKEKKNFVFS
jgi:hypothetical protein